MRVKPKHLVVSAVNFSEGGPLTVLQESLESAAQSLPQNWRITALVHRKELISNPRINVIEFPDSKRSWLKRLRLEWFEFNELSKQLKPDLWLSLHDITPRVRARRQAVYCHNASPFHQLSWREARMDPIFALFSLLYGYLYGFFIKRNYMVIVQQDWLRDAFRRLYSNPNLVVAYPTQHERSSTQGTTIAAVRLPTKSQPLVLLYPALPRVFKNLEVLCEAMQFLPAELRGSVELRLTLDGSENPYARDLYRRFSTIEGVKFIGRQTREEMQRQYRDCDVVLFPSRLETWGLPITEAKVNTKPLLVADLPYAHETVGNCEAVTFLPAEDARAWAAAIESLASGTWQFGNQQRPPPDAPFAADWAQLWRLLTDGL